MRRNTAFLRRNLKVSIPEIAPAGTSVLKTTARDEDVAAPNNVIRVATCCRNNSAI